MREQHAIELRQLRQEATEQADALRAELAAAEAALCAGAKGGRT